MADILRHLGLGDGPLFLPHGHCYFWDPLLLWLQNGSDALIAVSYFAIPSSLLYYLRRRPNVPLRRLIVLFATFIFLCGLTHVMDIVTTWRPYYGLQGLLKAVTAGISAFTAFVLIPLIPAALRLRSSKELEAANRRLETEIVERTSAQEALRKANLSLEAANQERLADLETERDRGRNYLRELQAQKDELAASNAELEQFAYAASHDLKAPLRAIDNLSQWISEDLGESVKPEVAEHLQMMRGRVHRMKVLLDSLLEYSRVGRLRHDPKQVDLLDLAHDVVETLPAKPGFRYEFDIQVPPFLAAATPLRQVLLNLVNNALKHHDRSQGLIRIIGKDRGGAVEISVSDDGPGIEERFHDRVFQIFQTLHPKDEVEGSGIGLALVKKIVETHQGAIRLESSPGQGSTFTVVWPKGQ